MTPAPDPAGFTAPRTDAELSEFLLRACHDLRGPMRTARIYAELLAKNGLGASEENARPMEFIVNGAATAGAVVDGISDYALALAIDPSRFQTAFLDVILRSAMAKLAAPIRESGAQIVYGELPEMRGDPDRLLQLFEYLLDQALRRRGTQIKVSAEQQGDGWQFTVGDNGASIAEIERLFTPFARLHSNQRSGPGLAICKAIVERHGGRMWAEPAAEGCSLRFTLPSG